MIKKIDKDKINIFNDNLLNLQINNKNESHILILSVLYCLGLLDDDILINNDTRYKLLKIYNNNHDIGLLLSNYRYNDKINDDNLQEAIKNKNIDKIIKTLNNTNDITIYLLEQLKLEENKNIKLNLLHQIFNRSIQIEDYNINYYHKLILNQDNIKNKEQLFTDNKELFLKNNFDFDINIFNNCKLKEDIQSNKLIINISDSEKYEYKEIIPINLKVNDILYNNIFCYYFIDIKDNKNILLEIKNKLLNDINKNIDNHCFFKFHTDDYKNYNLQYIIINGAKYDIIDISYSNKIDLINNNKQIIFLSPFDCVNNSIILMKDNKYYLFYLNLNYQKDFIKNICYVKYKSDKKPKIPDFDKIGLNKLQKYIYDKDWHTIHSNTYELIELSYNFLTPITNNIKNYENIFHTLQNYESKTNNIINNNYYKPNIEFPTNYKVDTIIFNPIENLDFNFGLNIDFSNFKEIKLDVSFNDTYKLLELFKINIIDKFKDSNISKIFEKEKQELIPELKKDDLKFDYDKDISNELYNYKILNDNINDLIILTEEDYIKYLDLILTNIYNYLNLINNDFKLDKIDINEMNKCIQNEYSKLVSNFRKQLIFSRIY